MRGERIQKNSPQKFQPTTTTTTWCRELQNGTFLILAYIYILEQTYGYKPIHYDLHISSLQENLNVLLISFYIHKIRKQIKNCFDWTYTQNTAAQICHIAHIHKTGGAQLCTCLCVIISPVDSFYIRRDNGVCLPKQAPNLLSTVLSRISVIFICLMARILIKQLVLRHGP